YQSSQGNYSCPVLIIMKYWYGYFILKPFYYLKDLGRFYIFNIDCSKTWFNRLNEFDYFLLISCRNTQRNCINTAYTSQQNRFSFHDRKCTLRTNVSETQNSRSVTYYSYVVPL